MNKFDQLYQIQNHISSFIVFLKYDDMKTLWKNSVINYSEKIIMQKRENLYENVKFIKINLVFKAVTFFKGSRWSQEIKKNKKYKPWIPNEKVVKNALNML